VSQANTIEQDVPSAPPFASSSANEPLIRTPEPDYEIIIVGSGFSGIGAAIELQKKGFHDFILLEKADDLGGTWRDATYPGLAVDMPSFIYSYPFEMSAEWERVYPTGREINNYTRHCAKKYGIRPHIRFGKKVIRTVYDEAMNFWRVHLESGDVLTARYFVSASGLLVEPKLPDIEGIEGFSGKLMHTGRWDGDFDLRGKRVGVIGTGASAIQVVPAIVDEVASMSIFQRTPIWLMSKPDAEISPRLKNAFRRLPFLQRWIRWAINVFVELTMGPGFIHYKKFPWMFDKLEESLIESMRSQVDDPETQEKLIPAYSFFCKRPSFSNTYYSCFNRESVELVTDPIVRVTEQGLRTGDGQEREFDVLICATGYSVFDRSCMPNFEVVGREGLNLGDFWGEKRFQAYEGATVPGFPNFFLFMGPYSAAGASYFTMIDTQSRHLTRCLAEAGRRGANFIEVSERAHEENFRSIEERRGDTLLFAGNCAPANSYYFDKNGDTPGLRPVTGGQHWWKSRTFSMKDYRFEARGSVLNHGED
jgi:cation diffusion facilitator CzcD-associated flavoprotein CzcO